VENFLGQGRCDAVLLVLVKKMSVKVFSVNVEGIRQNALQICADTWGRTFIECESCPQHGGIQAHWATSAKRSDLVLRPDRLAEPQITRLARSSDKNHLRSDPRTDLRTRKNEVISSKRKV